MIRHVNLGELRCHWEAALTEDGADNDLTSLASIDAAASGNALLVARQEGIFAGSIMFDLLREAYTHKLTIVQNIEDGQPLTAGTTIAVLTGQLHLLLGIERTLLNFLQRLCGVASMTRRYVDAVADTHARIYDTRKTIPGWRTLDKYAVGCGGGHNHRRGLNDAILVKDNHLAPFKLVSLADAADEIIQTAAAQIPPPEFVEFEVDTLEQLDQLMPVPGIDIILLDNFTPAQMRKAVERRKQLGLTGKIQFEASGGITLESVGPIAHTGVERISVGAITHSAPALDIAMEIEPAG